MLGVTAMSFSLLISELVGTEIAWFGVFEVWDTEGRSPTWQHNNKLDSWDKTALSYFISRNALRVCCCAIHDVIYATRHVLWSVLLDMRHSGFDASELTQGFGSEPYVVYSPPMVDIAWYDPNAGCCSCSTFDVSKSVSLTQ